MYALKIFESYAAKCRKLDVENIISGVLTNPQDKNYDLESQQSRCFAEL